MGKHKEWESQAGETQIEKNDLIHETKGTRKGIHENTTQRDQKEKPRI